MGRKMKAFEKQRRGNMHKGNQASLEYFLLCHSHRSP